MTVAEMHFAVEQGLQKVGSNSFDTFLPEELDFALNKMQERFIKQRFWSKSDPKQSGYYGTQKRIDDLRVLTVLDYTDDVLTPDIYADHEDFDLPTNYLFLINSRAKILHSDCQIDPELITNGDFSTATDWKLGDGTEDKWTIANGYIKHTPGHASSTEPMSQPIRISKGNKYLISIIVEGAAGGATTYAGTFTISLGPPGEPFKGNTSPTFDFFTNDYPRPFYQSTHATVAKQFILEANADNVSFQINPSNDYDGRLDKISVRPIKEIPLRIVEPDDAYNLLESPFSKSSHKSPMGVISDTFIKVFTDKRFLLKGVALDYIRVPSEIALSSNQDCELAEHTHQEIVDLTVKHLLEATEAPRYQTNSIEGSQSE